MPDVEDGGGEALVSPVRGAKASTSGAVDVVVVRRHEEGVSSIAAGKAAAIKKGFLSANDSEQDLCRYESDLMRLLRGTFDHPLPPARGIGNLWVAESDLLVNYWVWRVNPAHNSGQRERGCFTPAWVAVSILIGGLLLDVLISVSLGVAALPVNIIVGIAIVLGLEAATGLMLECCREWSLRRNHSQPDNADTSVSGGYSPTV